MWFGAGLADRWLDGGSSLVTAMLPAEGFKHP
jgi:hypothetical protein